MLIYFAWREFMIYFWHSLSIFSLQITRNNEDFPSSSSEFFPHGVNNRIEFYFWGKLRFFRVFRIFLLEFPQISQFFKIFFLKFPQISLKFGKIHLKIWRFSKNFSFFLSDERSTFLESLKSFRLHSNIFTYHSIFNSLFGSVDY